MLKRTEFSSPDGHVYLKCKTCKQEFYIVSAARYIKTICFCPYCGDKANKTPKSIDEKSIDEEDEYANYVRKR